MATRLQPHPLTSVMQMGITFCSICVAVAAIVFTVKTASDERNARLVEIGVSVLTADPEKQNRIDGARKWAIDLIDANSGAKFSPEARRALLEQRFYTEPFPGPASVNGTCKIFQRPESVIRGRTNEDQDWIDLIIESGVGGCGWPRPKSMPQSN